MRLRFENQERAIYERNVRIIKFIVAFDCSFTEAAEIFGLSNSHISHIFSQYKTLCPELTDKATELLQRRKRERTKDIRNKVNKV
jgi:hypothetical protein